MARQEGPREDLLAEAVALVERMEVTLASGEPVVVGFRKDGCASFFFDQDPVYQFNTAGELRRVYYSGLRYKADGRKLVSLEPRRQTNEVAMVRHAISADETAAMLSEAERRLDGLQAALAEGQFTLIGRVPVEVDVARRALAWLTVRIQPLVLADAPHAR